MKPGEGCGMCVGGDVMLKFGCCEPCCCPIGCGLAGVCGFDDCVGGVAGAANLKPESRGD